jgi:hypothetical protein
VTHIKGQRDADLHNEDGTHKEASAHIRGARQGQFTRRLTTHITAHAAEGDAEQPEESQTSKPETVPHDRVYVWLTDVETEAPSLPSRVKAADMWANIATAVTEGREKRKEKDARFLTIANGQTREVVGPAWG